METKDLEVRTHIIKRNGREVDFQKEKIVNAIRKANAEIAGIHQMNDFQIQAVADKIARQVAESSHAVNVEDIQDMVETGIMEMRCYEVAQKYMGNGGCGVVTFELAGGRPAAEAFMKHLKTAAIETHVADARTCCLHPASATHRQMSDEELAAAGVSPDLVRLSVGLESKEDLIEDLAQALAAV